MDERDDPGLYVIDPSEWPGAHEYLADRARQRTTSRQRYTEYLAAVLIGSEDVVDPTERAVIILDALTVWRRDPSAEPCMCSCHPRLPVSDLHDYGFACTCTKSPEERQRVWRDWIATIDEFWSSPEGQAITVARQAAEDELAAWLDKHPEVIVTSHGGLAPEQWTGVVDGHSFYFRERHDVWRIELDVRPAEQFVKRWKGGDLDDDNTFEMVEITRGDVIAEGTTTAVGYGQSPRERIRFITDTVRDHLARR